MKRFNLPVSLFLLVILIGCGTDSERSGLVGNWRLTEIEVFLDGSEFFRFSVDTDLITFEKGTFSYSENGLKKGTWMTGENGMDLSVTYGLSAVLSFPILLQTQDILTYQAATIDLSQDLNESATRMITLVALAMSEQGLDFNQEKTGGSEMVVHFTLTRE